MTFGEVLWAMLVFFFWVTAIWIFIVVFGDILRRADLSGGAKAGWILLIFLIPFVGALIYLAVRPRMPEVGSPGGDIHQASTPRR